MGHNTFIIAALPENYNGSFWNFPDSGLFSTAGGPEPAERLNIADMVEEENLQFLHPIESVYWAVEQGIIPCTGDGTTFSAGESCKRGEIAVFLYRAASALSGTDS